MAKLKDAQEELLKDARESAVWPAILAFCDIIEQNHINALATCDLTKPRELLIKRAQLDGVKALRRALASYNPKG